MAIALLEGQFTGTGASDPVEIKGRFNLSLFGFGSATVALERSFDGSNWRTVEAFSSDAERIGYEPETGIQYRANCSSYTSGTILLRVSQ